MRTFNMGIGMIVVVPAEQVKKAKAVLNRANERLPHHRADYARRPASQLQLSLFHARSVAALSRAAWRGPWPGWRGGRRLYFCGAGRG